MKKTISITISGLIFSIEEDGYERLKAWLDAIHLYFARYEDSREIINDIENRVAERFATKTGPERQAVTLPDVEELIAAMGTPADFEAMEDETAGAESSSWNGANTGTNTNPSPGSESSANSGAPIPPRRLYRDVRRKLVGGVASGIAAYFGSDPLWIRLIFVTAFLGLPLHLPAIPGMSLIAYLALWISMPPSQTIGDNPKVRRLFRHPESKVLGGVAGGISAYTGLDVAIIRLLFVVALFVFGTGILLYIILWLITPMAESLTDRMEMEGKPITIANIEETIRSSQGEKEGMPESALTRVILFPFRALAAIFSALGPVAIFLLEAIRICAGLFMMFIGIVLIVCLFIAAAALLGILHTDSDKIQFGEIPLRLLADDVPTSMVLSGFTGILMPVILILLLGTALLIKRSFLKAWVIVPLISIGIISAVIFSVSAVPYFSNFRTTGSFTVDRQYPVKTQKTLIDVHFSDYDSTDGWYEEPRLEIKQSIDDSIHIEMNYSADGKTRRQGEISAKGIRYGINHTDSAFIFDTHFRLANNIPFRDQRLHMVMYIPEGAEFIMSKDLGRILENTVDPAGYEYSDLGQNVWVFAGNQLTCLTCTHERYNMEDEGDDDGSHNGDHEGEDSEHSETVISGDSGSGSETVKTSSHIDAKGGLHMNVDVTDDSGKKEHVNISISADGLEVKTSEKGDKNGKKVVKNFRLPIHSSRSAHKKPVAPEAPKSPAAKPAPADTTSRAIPIHGHYIYGPDAVTADACTKKPGTVIKGGNNASVLLTNPGLA
ncbi:MAG: PspC domain-containing protein [Bacteroidota bacterium]